MGEGRGKRFGVTQCLDCLHVFVIVIISLKYRSGGDKGVSAWLFAWVDGGRFCDMQAEPGACRTFRYESRALLSPVFLTS